MSIPKLCLGTAQFGMDYGITNNKGQTEKKQIFKILNLFKEKGNFYIDTAESYGNAENLLGKFLLKENSLKLISKIKYKKIEISNSNKFNLWDEIFFKTLNSLKLKEIDSYLIHNPLWAYENEGDFFIEWMESLVNRNFVRRIGISIYSFDELAKLPLDKFHLVQLPLSVYDQRALTQGWIKYLKDRNIDIHIRSIFLQGLILQEPNLWPNKINNNFRDHHHKFLNFCKHKNVSLLENALDFVSKIREVEAILVGITDYDELRQILRIWDKLSLNDQIMQTNYKDWAWDNYDDLDPRKWKISLKT